MGRSPKTRANLIAHTKQRFLERYQIQINSAQIKSWNQDIQSQKENVKFLGKQSLSRTFYVIDEKYYVVYNKNLKSICTALTPEMMQSQLEMLELGEESGDPDWI